MDTEFTIELNGFKANIYMQTGFFNHYDMSFPLHNHPLIEMHVLLCGVATMRYGNDDMILREGDILCIPANVLHAYKSSEKGSKRISFFVDCGNFAITQNKITFPKTILPLLSKEIEEYVLTGKDNKLKPLLSYICSDFFNTEVLKTPKPITNRELIVHDFFSQKYNLDVTLDDLAKELLLSGKQTAREVKRITGNTFVGELAKRRINAAMILLQTTNLPITKICELVGYSSYSGFYKAYKRMLHNSQTKQDDT